MKAMVLAAGLGTRLRPLTDTRPKALVEIAGRTLLEITLTRLRSFGVNEVIINVHHFADMVVDYLKSKNNFDMRIEISREDDLLLDTGGGLKKAAWFFLEHSQRAEKSGVIPSEARNPGKASTQPTNDQKPDASANAAEPLLLHNVDVISTIDLGRMLQFHNEHRALATLAVQSRPSSRLLLFNNHLQLSGRAAPAEKAGGTGNPACAPQNAVTLNPSAAELSRRRRLQPPRNARQGTASAPLEKVPSGVIPSEARNPGRTPAQPNTDQTPLASNSGALHPLAFSGIHIISPRLLPRLTEDGVFSIIDSYLRLAAEGERILAFRADDYYWRDLGRPADLSQAAEDMRKGAWRQ